MSQRRSAALFLDAARLEHGPCAGASRTTRLPLPGNPSASTVASALCNARSKMSRVFFYGLTLALVGCAASVAQRPSAPSPQATSTRVVEPPAPLRVATTIVTPDTAADVSELFAAGQTSLRQGDPAAAARTIDRIVEQESEGSWLERALFQGALAHEANGDLEGAAQRFEQLGRRFPNAALASEALLRSMRVRLHQDAWAEAGQTARAYLERYPGA